MTRLTIGSMAIALCACAIINDERLEQRIDADNDGYIAEQFDGDDCDDQDPSVHPGAEDFPYDGEDTNCDDAPDFDQDGDGADAYQYGGTDCDDADPTLIDEVYWYPDSDKDGYGAGDSGVKQCEGPPSYIRNGDDCDDSSAQIRPGATEVCDGQDNNCDGATDPDGSEGSLYFMPDVDGDTYGDNDTANWVFACELPTHPDFEYVTNTDDCNDEDSAVNPEAIEICNDLQDNNCNNDDPDNCELSGFGYINPTSSAIGTKAHLRLKSDATSGESRTFGWWVGGVGDVDDDGVDDFLVSAPTVDADRPNDGVLYFFGGRAVADGGLGLDSRATWESAESEANATYNGGFSGGVIGGHAIPLGDVNADGFDDFAVENCGINTSGGGRVELFWGRSDFLSPSRTDPLNPSLFTGLTGSTGGKISDSYGCSLAAGDVNKDGHIDLFMSATGENNQSSATGGVITRTVGAVYLAFGPLEDGYDVTTDALRIHSEPDASKGTDAFARTMASGGDMNADGWDEFAVTSLKGDDDVGFGGGAVHLLYGYNYTGDFTLDEFDAQFTGDSSYGMAGEAVRFGDVNGDGYDDMVVSSPKHGDRRGMVYIKFGRTSPYDGDWSLWKADVRLRGNRTGDALGQSVAVIRPLDDEKPRPLARENGLNGDDNADLWIGAAGQNPSETVYLVYGPLDSMTDVIGSHAAVQFHLSDTQQSVVPMNGILGGRVSVGGAGDFNGDGYVDLLAGFPWHNPYSKGTTQNGLVGLFLGGGI